jgi:DNA modification methylase
VPKNTAPLDLADLAQHLPVPHQVGQRHLAVHTDNYAWMPDKSVDLVLTDPPFNIAQDTNFHTYEGNTINSFRFDADKGWDSYDHQGFLALLHSWAAEFNRVLRPGGSFAIFCADAYVSHLIDALEANGLSPRRTVSWRKPNAMPVNRKYMMMSSCEYVVVGVKGRGATFNADLLVNDLASLTEVESYLVGDKVGSVIEAAVRAAVAQVPVADATRPDAVAAAAKAAVEGALPDALKRVTAMYAGEGESTHLRACVPNYVEFNSKAGNRLHPTEKPVTVLRYLMSLMSKPGDVVLDPFGGSGSTGEAALALGRRVVLVERDEEFFQRLSGRLASFGGQELVIDPFTAAGGAGNA